MQITNGSFTLNTKDKVTLSFEYGDRVCIKDNDNEITVALNGKPIEIDSASPFATPNNIDNTIRDILAKDGKIAAVKYLRSITNGGLKPCKHYVEALMPPDAVPSLPPLAERIVAVYKNSGFYAAIELAAKETGVSESVAKEFVSAIFKSQSNQDETNFIATIREMVKSGQMIDAVKQWKNHYGCDVYTAHRACAELRDN